uniref:Uncharacterized protein n=1 Tax=Chaetoceros debilis TaxID=122233 RepID=A0A7S3PW02_9STRA
MQLLFDEWRDMIQTRTLYYPANEMNESTPIHRTISLMSHAYMIVCTDKKDKFIHTHASALCPINATSIHLPNYRTSRHLQSIKALKISLHCSPVLQGTFYPPI